MLMTMRAQIEAMRALGYYTAAGIDGALKQPDKAAGRKIQDRVDLLIPIVKAWFTDLGNEIASTGVQIHGGMGFVEETGAAQHLRDARILPSTKAPTASRRATWWAARSPRTAARRCWPWSPRCAPRSKT